MFLEFFRCMKIIKIAIILILVVAVLGGCLYLVKDNPAELVGPVITAAATIAVALLIDRIRKAVEKSDLRVTRSESVKQGGRSFVRLIVENRGDYKARGVTVDVVGVVDGGISRTNFVPAPLNWTHSLVGGMPRDIYSKQTVYLDLLEVCGAADIRLAAPHIRSLNSLASLTAKYTTVTLHIYQESGQVKVQRVEIVTDGGIPQINIK